MLTCFSSPHYVAPLPPGHVFPMSKFSESAHAIAQLPNARVIDPGIISEHDLLKVHTPDYVRSILTGQYNERTQQKLGLPWSPELARRSRCATAGTLRAAETALREGLAANLAGGTHHAFPDRGEGFCVFNDIAVTIRVLHELEPYMQFMVIDLDAHQGNATNFIFQHDRNVFTYSVHVGKNYPSKKEPGSMDVELPRWATGSQYFDALKSTLPEALDRFDPDLVFYIAGADPHIDDRFGQMGLSTEEMAHRDEWTIELTRSRKIPTAITYGGGYNKTPGMTAQLHVQTIRIAANYFENESRLAGGHARRLSQSS